MSPMLMEIAKNSSAIPANTALNVVNAYIQT